MKFNNNCKQMARKSNAQSLGEVITDMLKIYRLDDKMREIDLGQAWKETMGQAVANRTKEVRLRKRTLIIRMDSGVMKEEFSYNKGKIADMLNEKLGVNAIDMVEIW